LDHQYQANALLIFPWLNRLKGPAAPVLLTYGAVPLMAYVAHL
jgi:hypothetical protein